MKKLIKTLVQFSLITAFALSLSVNAEDKKPARTFNAAASELIGKVRKLVAEDRAKGFAEYAKGARALAKAFPGDARPFTMMIEASGLIEDKKNAALLKEQAEAGILAILKKDKKVVGFGDVLLTIFVGGWLGVFYGILCLFLASIIGIFLAIYYKSIKKESLIPFGTCIAVSFIIISIIENYYNLKLFIF